MDWTETGWMETGWTKTGWTKMNWTKGRYTSFKYAIYVCHTSRSACAGSSLNIDDVEHRT